ncbi:MAG: hypothetical protein WBC94_13540 [Xanthobacteraceae bacterium]
MNGFCRCTSAPIHPVKFKHAFENCAMSLSPPRNNKENKMLRKFAAALVAAALIAGPAFAQSNGTSGAMPSAPAGQTAPAAPAASTPAAKPSVKTTKAVKHTAKRVSHHASRSKKSSASHQARHAKPAKTHQAGTAKSGKAS